MLPTTTYPVINNKFSPSQAWAKFGLCLGFVGITSVVGMANSKERA